jgi:hypothetical protein
MFKRAAVRLVRSTITPRIPLVNQHLHAFSTITLCLRTKAPIAQITEGAVGTRGSGWSLLGLLVVTALNVLKVTSQDPPAAIR